MTATLEDQFQRDVARLQEVELERWRGRSRRAQANEHVLKLARREL